MPLFIILTGGKTLQPVHVKAVPYPHDFQRIGIMKQTAQGLYLLWQMVAGVWFIFVADGFTTLPGQGLPNATVAQVFPQVISTGLFPLHGVFPISLAAGVMKQAGFDQQWYHVVGKCQCLRVMLLFTQLQNR